MNATDSRLFRRHLSPVAAIAFGLLLQATCWSADQQVNEQKIREAPKVLRASEVGVGRLVPDFTLTTLAGKQLRLTDFSTYDGVVIAMTGTGCPLCKKYAPTLANLEKVYQKKNIAFIFINPNSSEAIADLQKEARRLGLSGPYVRDSSRNICGHLDVKTTTEVFVLDRSRTLIYRGAVDDQHGFGYSLEEPRNRYLQNALDALIDERRPLVAATSAPGCELLYDHTLAPEQNQPVTYFNQVARIINANCIECHRDGGIGPMAFESYEQVKDYAGMIANVVKREVMPPWFAAPLTEQGDSDADSSAHWMNDRSLSETERKQLLDWVSAGAPVGNALEAPITPKFPDGWLIGQPDAVFKFAEPIAVKASGTMPYQYVTVETDLDEDKWIQAIEVRPGKIDVVHHVIVSLRSEDIDEVDERDGFWGVYVPGNSTLIYPEGMAKLLPKGAKLRFQMHYTPNGTATEDLTSIGLVFAEREPQYEVKVKGIANTRLRIPPNADNHRVTASIPIPIDVQILSFLPHMHLRGKAAQYELIKNTSNREILLDVPQYDFNWQLVYRLSEPRALQEGDSLRFTSWYDNSVNNPANPDPNKTVKWGQQTYDEMHLGYVEYIVPVSDRSTATLSRKPGKVAQGLRNLSGKLLFRRLDVNGDGVITRDEVRQKMPNNKKAFGSTFDRLDLNGDNELDRQEFSRL